MNDTQSQAWLAELAANAITALLGATPAAPTVKLAKAPFVPGPLLDPATITEADFTGYAAKTITAWGTVHSDGNGQQIFDPTTPLNWTPTGSTTANTIYGYILLDSHGVLLQSGLLPTPKILNGTATTLTLLMSIPFAGGAPVLLVGP